MRSSPAAPLNARAKGHSGVSAKSFFGHFRWRPSLRSIYISLIVRFRARFDKELRSEMLTNAIILGSKPLAKPFKLTDDGRIRRELALTIRMVCRFSCSAYSGSLLTNGGIRANARVTIVLPFPIEVFFEVFG